jgi:hypothetical protein
LPAWLIISQTDPRSGPRSELNAQKRFHSSDPLRYAGALTTNQLAAAASTVSERSRQRRSRRQMIAIGPSRNSG